ncbi:MAG: peptidylprolyl isomerase [Deltaproteobacteria bacterium]|nr:peptidylprolyl isomerase [Deltaproteobacteria bacterium]
MQANTKVWAIAALLAGFVVAPAASARLVDRIVATVNNEVILQSEVDAECKDSLEAIPPDLPLEEAVRRKHEIRARVLDGLIDEMLVKQQIVEHQIEIEAEDVERYIEQLRKLNNLNEEQFKQAVAREGKTMEEFRQQIRKQLERDKLLAREIQSRLRVTEKDVEAYYQAHYKTRSAKEKVRASHILFSLPTDASPEQEKTVRDRADKALALLEAGADFAKTAEKLSDDPSASNGGDLGWFRRGDMVAAFEKAAFGLDKGRMSKLVRTRFGYHIILVTDRAVEGPPTLDAVEKDIRMRLMQERRAAAIRNWLDDLRRRSHVEIKL